ncbi:MULTISPECIES: hypothetical protein [Alicyclobacillus]|uniref:Uncharacterized protein n=2 Tax=Alicyclobacillus TaxID=29330 RepID=F8IJH6_ALIAT|nr:MULTISPECIES: hypothetical protein [Alicyclobacillus]AEJ44689.1 hypothetical protein TC41_2796 [Alicyclobacillus acidocaldarius subsp. acidocaldarius Tc-4-1]MBF8378020.1 hypothetical protein [Alicyclobacillus mali (ex Roth et al. 2021)]MCL6488850.1 hypothetical protein [Alicyclobacillus mali (ex Roth et al. 2021)]
MAIPALVFIGANNSMTPQQNAGTFIGQVNNGAWDANMKFQAGKSGNYDVMSYNLQIWSLLFDSFEFIDGQVNTLGLKPDVEGNV